MLPIKKIDIDSRNRTTDSVDGSNFKTKLPYTLEMPDNTVFFVTDVCIPHVYKLIEAGVNQKLYFKYFARKKSGDDGLPYSFWGVATLPAGGYTDGNYLATQIQTAMNNVIDSNANISFSASWDSNQLQIKITCSGDKTTVLMCSPKNIIFENDCQRDVLKNNGIWGSSYDPNNLNHVVTF